MRKVAVTGVGMTKFGPSNYSLLELYALASREAMDQAELRSSDIDALFISNVLGDFGEGQINISGFVADELGLKPGIPAVRYEGACASGAVAVRNAMMMVAAGWYDTVVVAGAERILHMGTQLATRVFAMGTDCIYEEFSGLTFPGVFAMLANLYAQKYGIPLQHLKEEMAMVAVKNHRNAMHNPLAQFHKEITVGNVLSSPIVADPLQLYDCCPFSDGAAAVVLTTEEKARKQAIKPVFILGAGQGSAGALIRQKDYTVMKSRVASAKQAYDMAGLEPKDIDLCEVHDCFTIAEIVASECLGFFEFGKGADAAGRRETAIGGKIPINPSGGLKAKGHPIGATGVAQVYEVVKQLRGECGDRQVDGARIGMTDTLGGDAGTIVNIIFGV